MSQTLQNQLLLAKSMNSIISLSDGAGTTITNGQIVTNDLSGTTITAGSLNTGDLNLTGSVDIPAVNDITTSYGLVSLKNAGKTYLVDTTYIDGGITASATQTITFGTNAPTMSGANIGSGTIGQTQVSNGYVALSGAQTSIAGAKTFTTLPLSTDTTAPTANNLIRKAYADVTYPVILNSINSLYGGSGAFGGGTSTAQYCIALGTSALAVTTGGFNQGYGTNALLRCTNGAFNIAFGVNSLSNVTSGQSNMAIGTNSLPAGNCSESIGIGQSALQFNTAAPGRNTGIGAYVLQNTVASSLCTAIGYNAGIGGIINGNNNTFIGASTSMAGDYSNSTVIGYNSQASASNQITLGTASETTRILGALTVAGSSTFSTAPTMSGANISSASIPNAALQSNVTLNDTTSTISALKTFTGGITASATQTITFGTNAPTMSGANIGSATIPYASIADNVNLNHRSNAYNYYSGSPSILTTGDTNTFYGYDNVGSFITTGGSNSFFGSSSGRRCALGSSSNTAFGVQAMGYTISSNVNSFNCAIGNLSMGVITSGNRNTSCGYNCAGSISSGSFNSFYGNLCGYNTVSGNYNCGIGDSCFSGNLAYDASYCSFVGASATLSAAGLSYSTVIGAGATSGTSSSVTLGRTNDTTIIPSAKVQYGGSYRPNSVFQTISANTDWNASPPTNLPQYILFSGISTTTYTLTLPAISNANIFEGMEFQFRRTNTTASATTTSILQVTASGTDTIYGIGVMTTAASVSVLASGAYYGRLVCVNKTTTPYNWAYFA